MKRLRIHVERALALLLLTLMVSASALAGPKNPFSVSADALAIEEGASGKLALTFHVPPNTYLFADMAELVVVEAKGVETGESLRAPGVVKMDPNLGVEREIWDFDGLIELPVTGVKAGSYELVLEARYQGCKEGICFLPKTEPVRALVTVTEKSAGLIDALIPEGLVSTAHAGELSNESPVDVTVKVEGAELVVDFRQMKDWHLSQMMTFVELAEGQALTLGEGSWPKAHMRPDPAIPGAERGEFDGDFEVRFAVTGPEGAYEVEGTVGYQACKAELCLLPQYYDFKLPITIEAGAEAAVEPVADPDVVVEPPPVADGADEGPAIAAAPETFGGDSFSEAREKGLIWLTLFVFGAGFLVSLTPCVLPMVPITIGIIGASESSSRLHRFSLAMTYVAGMAVVYTVLGVGAAMTGSIFGGWMQSPWVVGTVALFFAAMGLAMFGFFEVAVPSAITSRIASRGGTGFGGAFIVGAIGAVVAGPCSGPVIASLMVLIGQQGELALGAALMMSFSLGMGMIFLVAGTFSGSVLRPGAWMDTIKKAFGIVMWLGAIYFVSAHLSDLVVALLTAAVLLTTAVFGWPSDDSEGPMIASARRLYGVTGGIIGAYLLLGVLVTEGFILPPLQLSSGTGAAASEASIPWQADEAGALASAEASNKPLVIDFTADWCAACKELEHFTYSDEEVIALAERFVPVMIDATSDKDPQVAALLEKYEVKGLPTVLFLQPNGTVIDRLTLTGFEPAESFLPRMNAALDALK